MASSLFAIQVFLRLYPGNPLRENLNRLIREAPEMVGFEQKRQLYWHVSHLIVPAMPSIEYGNWEFTDDSSEAESEYEKWCSGTVQDAQDLEEEQARQAATSPYRSQDIRYMFLTQLFLLQQGSAGEQYIANACNIPQDQLWTRRTFYNLLSVIPTINFLHVIGNAIYLFPSQDDQGLTQQDLSTERYSYVRQVK